MIKTEKLLRELVALPSVNPAFLPEGDPCAGERRVAEFLAATAAGAGLDVEIRPVLPERPNVLARLSPRGKARRRVILAPHTDTVNGSRNLFSPRSKGGRVYGRGACDTKGSVAAMLSALCDLARNGARPLETEILFAALIDEENGQAGSRALAASGIRADLAIVGEPTRLKVVTAHKGNLWLQLETTGKAAHGSNPEQGRNAIEAMSRAVVLLESTYAAQIARRRHSLLGYPTVNVGVISGGTQPNIVPDRCRMLLDRRTVPGETDADVRWEIHETLRRAGIKATVQDLRQAPCPPMETSLHQPIVAQFMRTMRQRQPVGVHYFCDAAVLSDGGIPSVVFGPGDIAQAHTPDEWIAIDSLERGRAMLSQFLGALP